MPGISSPKTKPSVGFETVLATSCQTAWGLALPTSATGVTLRPVIAHSLSRPKTSGRTSSGPALGMNGRTETLI